MVSRPVKVNFPSKTEVQCRSCGKSGLEPVLNLGKTPLANALLDSALLGKPEAFYPLELVFCPNCSLLQINETVAPEILFTDYFYLSSFSDTMVQHAKKIADRLTEERGLGGRSLVAEIASNDGYLLQHYNNRGVPVLGIEPARNIARLAEDRGVRTVCEFFGEEVARRLAGEIGCADVVHANNVIAHVANLNSVIEGIHILLKNDGVAVIETPYVKEMLDNCEFDTIYHEHLCYYSLTALSELFGRHGMMIIDVEKIPIHGGSIRVFAAHAGNRSGPAVAAMLAEESAWGANRFAGYQGFAGQVERLKINLLGVLGNCKKQGKRIAAYGASAKGSTLMNTFGIGENYLEFVVDRSTVKQGHYTPGGHLPIYAPEKLMESFPDYVLLLTWNFAEEILNQQSAYRARGGKFIIPIPEPKVV